MKNLYKYILFVFLLILFLIADFNYLMRVDQYNKHHELSIELENKLADLKVLHSKLYNYDEIRERILSNEELGFRPAQESEIKRWQP